jgi:hypothetical protein
MDKVDDFIKGKMEQRDFEFSETHWMQAAQMIDAQEKKRKKAFWIWLFLGQVMVLGIAYGMWDIRSNSTPENINKPQIVADKQSTIPVPNNDTQESIQETKSSSSDDLSQKNKTENTAFVTNSLSSNSQNATSSQSSPNPQQTTSKTNKATANNQINDSTAEIKPGFPGQSNANTIASKKNPLNETTMNDPNTPEHTLTAAMEEINNEALSREANSLVRQLPLLSFSVDHKLNNNLNKETKLPTSTPLYKTTLNIIAASTLYPYSTVGSKKFIGYTFGVNYARNLKKAWAFEAGIHYRLRQGTFTRSQSTEKTTYAFSRSVEQFFSLPEQIHSLEIPLSVTFIKNRHNASIGLNYAYLLGVKGSLNRQGYGEGFSSNQLAEVIEKGWVDASTFKQNHYDLFAAYYFSANTNLSVGVKAHYTIGSILQDSNSTTYTESKPFFFDLGLRYNLFKR